MARGDGKARKGLTKGSSTTKPRYTSGGVQKLAFGGKPGESAMARAEASRGVSSGGLGASTRDGGFGGSSPGGAGGGREGGFGGAGIGRLESPGQRGSVIPGAGNISAGRIAGGGGRNDLRNPQSNTARVDYLTNPARASARLGPNAAQAMADAGVNPDTANYAAGRINALVGSGPTILGDQSPGQRMATYNADGSITYSGVPTSTKTKQFYDRILPEEDLPVRAALPTRPVSYTPAPRPAAPPTSPMAVYGNEFSFTPEQTTNALKSLYSARQPGASYSELMGLQKAIKEPANKAMAATLAAPFSSRTRAPMAPVAAPERPMRPASTLAGYTGQEQRFAPAPATKQFADQIVPGGTKQFYDRILPEVETPKAPAGATRPPSVVAGRTNFSPARAPFDQFRGGRDDDRPRRRRPKPIIGEETVTNVRHGGPIRGDGKAAFGKTKGRYI